MVLLLMNHGGGYGSSSSGGSGGYGSGIGGGDDGEEHGYGGWQWAARCGQGQLWQQRTSGFVGWHAVCSVEVCMDCNCLTTIRVLVGTINSRPVGFVCRNNYRITAISKHNFPQNIQH
jgi:hypothetical protein